MGIFYWIPVIPVDSSPIPVESGPIPVESGPIPADSGPILVDSTGMTGFHRNDVGHQKVLQNGKGKWLTNLSSIHRSRIQDAS